MNGCIYPDCQIKTDFGAACEHSCEAWPTKRAVGGWSGIDRDHIENPPERRKDGRPKPKARDCLAWGIPGATCQFPDCDC